MTVLQAVRLKGRVSPHDLAAALAEDVTNTVERLVDLLGARQIAHIDFKALVTDWQLNRDPAALARMDGVHERVLPIIAAAAAQLPRLDAYRAKLLAALEKIKAGDTAWLTRPLVDSYHTVWFELHEELIAASGLTREEHVEVGEGARLGDDARRHGGPRSRAIRLGPTAPRPGVSGSHRCRHPGR